MNIKTWAERAESLSDDTVVTSLHLAQFKQSEIDELRAENELQLDSLKVAAAENARLRSALADIAYGQPHTAHTDFVQQAAC